MSTPSLVAPTEAFDTWAQVYDEQPNPLLSLEQRFLSQLLPDIRGLDILDAGCGTGRWLQHLALKHPASLVGVDTSPEMLRRAEIKLGKRAILHHGTCVALPIRNMTIDIVIASFVLSYLENIEALAQELNRVTRPGATVFLTDMHPDTAISRNWKRSFKADGSETQVQVKPQSLRQITEQFQACGFELLTLIEPPFQVSEKQIFSHNGKLDEYEAAATLPAIYILQLRKPSASLRHSSLPDAPESLSLNGATYALGPETSTRAAVTLENGRIHSISSYKAHRKDESSAANSLDLSDYLLLPGLVNAHDHLEFSLFPNLGSGPYQNSTEWAAEIHRVHAAVIARHRSVPKPTRLWWGGVRNLLCGVTSVCHHNPLTRELLASEFPVRILSKFGWAHSLAVDPNLERNFDHTPPNLPFVVHAAEGVDPKSEQEIFDLDRMQILCERTGLVHALALTTRTVALINRRGASVILCPTSNQFLFHITPSPAFIRSLNTVALGSDSPLTAAGDLLDEVNFAHARMSLDANSLYQMVMATPAKVLRLRDGEGHLRSGAIADVIAVRNKGLSPAETLAQLTAAQVELVILSGRIQLASPALYQRLPDALKSGLQPLAVDNFVRWVRAPITSLLAETHKVLGNDIRLGGKRIGYAGTA
jgi:cytosine/adenosine deaminase-related metal-dependent hydrolase/ubiquinone/menaquinone biosynthesis C-methylase UbiE